MDERDEATEFLDPRELARERRRDRDLSAPERAGMRTGLAKGFKQIMDVQAKRAEPGFKPPKKRKKARKRV